jgi:hypothetical protein
LLGWIFQFFVCMALDHFREANIEK